jgi:hypothetical protein
VERLNYAHENEAELLRAVNANDHLRADIAALRHFICHHGGLINVWGREWMPDKHPPLTDFIAERLDATIKELSL